jgi:hypothetical protein
VTDPGKNFQNPAYDGLRGVPGSTLYGEYRSAPVWQNRWSGTVRS